MKATEQLAAEIDRFADSVVEILQPRTPHQDLVVILAVEKSASSGAPVRPPATDGLDPTEPPANIQL